MRGLLMVAGLGLFVGCAHAGGRHAEHELRGLAQVASEGRMLVAGPASLVHANLEGTKPVTLFVVERVSGSDADCAKPSAPQTVRSEGKRAQLTVAAGHVLCAASETGPTDVMWHAHVDANPSVWALR
jgi:hypothetical protein